MLFKSLSTTKKINQNLNNINVESVLIKYKEFILNKLSLKKRNIEFTINNTKACNSIIKYVATASNKPHILVSSTDDTHIISYCKTLEKNGTIDLSIISLGEHGYITTTQILKYICAKTKLIIVPYVNIDLATINDIKSINTLAKEKNILLYCNLNYTFGRMIKYDIANIDFISISFIYIDGPKDINLLIHKSDIKIDSTINTTKHIEPILNSLLSISSFKMNSNNYKKLFIKKLDEIFNLIEYTDYIKMYKPAITKISIVILNSNVNNIDKYLLPIAIFSKDKSINNIHFKDIDNIFLPTFNTLTFDDYIKKGYLIITFDNITSEAQVNKLLKSIVICIKDQYQHLIAEIKDTVIAKKKIAQKPKKTKISFDSKLTYDLMDSKNVQKPHNKKKIKSILKCK